jgi:sugar-specific transcriptional regulator TrmB
VNSSDEDVSTLAELGLTVSQAKVYLSLAKAKNLTAQAISTISKVARPDVYRILVQLQEAGLVEKMMTKPEESHAIPIGKCVSILMQRRIRKTEELQKKALTLAQSLRRKTASEEPNEKFEFMLIHNRDAVYAKAEKMLTSAQECICFLGLTRRMFSWLSNCSPILEEALVRKVDCRMIMPQPETNHGLAPLKTLGKYSNFVLRLISGSPKAAFSVWDRKEVLITTSTVDTPFPASTLWSNNKGIVDLSQDYFEFLWQKAEKQA